MTDRHGPPAAPDGETTPSPEPNAGQPVVETSIPPPQDVPAPGGGIPPDWFFPPDDEPTDALPRRPLLRRALIALYIFVVLCVIIALLATFIPWGDLDIPFDPPFRYREYI